MTKGQKILVASVIVGVIVLGVVAWYVLKKKSTKMTSKSEMKSRPAKAALNQQDLIKDLKPIVAVN